ncbi:hypothetical protein LCGC14_1415060 [marine sediment metagenome]|uniref:Uncharacterized protein n=1 Tax=marine sediment metagenome TaxID=412755 RepID=A0A0F9KE80_9ZZZZ
MRTPKLKKIDLKKRGVGVDDSNHHPDIRSNGDYLIIYDGQFYTGQFEKVWFGWTIYIGFWCQLDSPGIEAIWRICQDETETS